VVTINGTNFICATKVKFDLVAASFTVNSATKITATVPSGATTGRIKVITPGGKAVSSSKFTVTAGVAPTITSFSPTSGPVGTVVTINGIDLTGATKVTFDFVAASFTVNSDTKITATVPAGATSGRIRVTTPGGTAVSATAFKVTAAPPTITSFSPVVGHVGTAVTINGTDFTGATKVTFDFVSAWFTVNSSTKITAIVPRGAGTGPIGVKTPAGTDTSDGVFTVVHRRRVSLSLGRHLVATGMVTVTDGFSACWQDVLVLVQRRVSGHWRTVAARFSDDSGSYRVRLSDRTGWYRSVVLRSTLSSGDVCGRAVSGVHRHRH